jgi:hypothetical protein
MFTTAAGSDFDWSRALDAQASQNPVQFRLSLAERFKLSDQELDLVLKAVSHPADAYVLLRLGELSRQPASRLVEQYQQDHAKGWGVLARHLGIKPGSAEFHALKRGHDLRGYKQELRPSKIKSTKEIKRSQDTKHFRPEARRHAERTSHTASHKSNHAAQHDHHSSQPAADDSPATPDH